MKNPRVFLLIPPLAQPLAYQVRGGNPLPLGNRAHEHLSEDKKVTDKTQTTILIEIGEEADLWHTPDGQTFATVEIAGVHQNLAVDSPAFSQWLSRRLWEEIKKAPSSTKLTEVVRVLQAEALYDGGEHQVHIRVARHGDTIYLDLGGSDWTVIGISPVCWRPVINPPVRFCRSSGMLALPFPQSGGSVGDLRSLINVRDEDAFILTVAWLIGALNPAGPYPVALIQGEQGSAKSTLARTLKALIDPATPALMTRPKNEQDFVIAGSHARILAFDNLSSIPSWLSDAFCRMATGAGFKARKLYTDKEEVRFDICRPQILNGIEDLATRDDLRDRGILFELPVIPSSRRITEKIHREQLEKAHPKILGALLDAVATALANESDAQPIQVPRMADFAIWVSAAEPALPWPPGEILRAYERNRADAITIVLDNDPVASAIIKMAEKYCSWRGTATALYTKLTPNGGYSSRAGWPLTVSAFSQRLRRLAAALRHVGVDVTWERESDHKRTRKIRVRAVRAVQGEES